MPPTGPIETRSLAIDGAEALPWERALAAFRTTLSGEPITWFLGVTDPDGRPHAAGVGAIWTDDEAYFVSGPGTRKSRALVMQPAASLSVALPGIDLVLEGTAHRVTDTPTLERIAAVYRSTGWPVEVAGDAFAAPFSAPSAGPAPWHLYRLDHHTVFGVASVAPHGATRWRFGDR